VALWENWLIIKWVGGNYVFTGKVYAEKGLLILYYGLRSFVFVSNNLIYKLIYKWLFIKYAFAVYFQFGGWEL